MPIESKRDLVLALHSVGRKLCIYCTSTVILTQFDDIATL